jgi:hypothetical protein
MEKLEQNTSGAHVATLTGNIAFSCLLSTWPFIKKLHVDSFMLDGDHGCLLKNFPALEELLVNGFAVQVFVLMCTRAHMKHW